MPLHPDAQRVIDEVAAQGPPPEPGSMSPDEMRRMLIEAWVRPGPFEPVGDVYDGTIPGADGELSARVYLPAGDPLGLLVWFHGGGWVVGSLEENEAACRALVRGSGAAVLSVAYRLAPEHRFPAAADDAFAAVRWAAEHGAELGAARGLAVGGESAGGNLAAVCALMARDRGGPSLALQLLVSPVLGEPGDGRASYSEFADGFFLSRASMEWFFEQYPRDAADLRNPYMLPLVADDLGGVAPALVMTAEYDVLRDEGEQYARRLGEAGVPCELVRYDGQIHGFFGLLDDKLSIGPTAHAHAARALREAFAGVAAG